jgi:hypothetical protein
MDNIDFALLRKLLKTQDMGEKGIERICNELKDGTFNPLRDPVTNVIIWAISDIQFELASDRAILDSISNLVLVDMQKYVKTTNIPVEIQSVIIGAATPPQDVLAETVHTAAQKQRILTQNATKQAEDARKAAEIAKADADKAYQTQMNMSVDQYLQLRSIEIQKEKVQLIKDKQNVSIIFGDVQPVKQVQ